MDTSSTGGGSGGIIVVGSVSGASLGNLNTSSAGGGNGGQVLVWTGNSGNAATLSVGQINTSGANGGLVELVNSAAFTADTNLTVSGTITTDASNLDGRAGPVALVATGAISVPNAISAQATANPSSTSALGGSVFISSGGTGSTAITAGTINTSAANNGSGDRAGNIILLSSAASSGDDPSNISASSSNFTQAGARSELS